MFEPIVIAIGQVGDVVLALEQMFGQTNRSKGGPDLEVLDREESQADPLSLLCHAALPVGQRPLADNALRPRGIRWTVPGTAPSMLRTLGLA